MVRWLPAKPQPPPTPTLTILGELSVSFNWNLALGRSFHRSAGSQRSDVPGSRLQPCITTPCSENLPARLKVLTYPSIAGQYSALHFTNLATSFLPFCMEFFSTMDLDKGNAIPPQTQPPIRALPDDGQPCRECRRRKAKCDRTTPVCNICQRYKRHCLYDKHSRTSLTRKSGTLFSPL